MQGVVCCGAIALVGWWDSSNSSYLNLERQHGPRHPRRRAPKSPAS